MTKETNQPKAINIIRPNNTNNNNNILYNSSSGSTASTSSRRTGNSSLSVTSTNSTRKPKVAGTPIVKPSLEKPLLNLYHPPARKSSYDNNSKRPTIELYKPPSQQPKLTKSFTLPSSATPNATKLHNNNGNIQYNGPSYIRPQQQPQQQHHRSVLGVINNPVSALNHTALSETISSPLIIDQQISEESNMTKDQEETEDGNDNAIDDDDEDEDDHDDEDDKIDEDDKQADDEEEEEGPVINEARVNRKIADLELSINSLLTVNGMLEATVRKQASQLSQFKKQMSLGEGAHVDFFLDHNQEEMADPGDPNVNQNEDQQDDWEDDALFQKLRKLTEYMIEQGQKSIAFEYKILGRVLLNYSALDENDENQEDGEDEDDDTDENQQEEGTTNMVNVVAAAPSKNLNAKTQTQGSNNTIIPTAKKNHTSSIPRNTKEKGTSKS